MASDCADPKLILVALQSRPVPLYAFAILGAGWFLWVLPFFLVNKQKQPAKQVDKRALGNYSRRSGLCDLVAGALLGDAAAALARCVKRNFLCVRRAAFLNGSARPRQAVARGRRPHRRSSTGDSWAVSRRAPSHLPIHAVHSVRHGISFRALVVVRSVSSIFRCRDGDSRPHRGEIAGGTFRRTVRRIQAARSGLHSVSPVARFLTLSSVTPVCALTKSLRQAGL
jgi:hypothetical protein